MTALLFEDFLMTQRRRAGPLGTCIDPFVALLAECGYARVTVTAKVRLIAEFGSWLHRRGLGVHDVDERCIGEFVRQRKRHGNLRRGEATTLRDLVTQLRGAGLVAPAPAMPDESAMGQTLREFECYLELERGLCVSTRVNYVPMIRWFLSERFGHEEVKLGALQSQDAGQFLLRHGHKVNPRRVRLIVTALRCFLRWLQLRGDVANDLAATVPSVAHWRLATLPKSIPAKDVESLLRNCCRRSEAGLRDYAILLLMARLGLRGGEVVALELDDIDWKAGTLETHGKRGRPDLLPLPVDVGQAIAEYLRCGRQVCSSRKVFVRAKAPRRGFASTVAICTIVRRALERAGLDPPRKGGHILRHALACTMLRHGATLTEIGQILRHRHPDTTAIYAKVDRDALRALAPAWPRGGR